MSHCSVITVIVFLFTFQLLCCVFNDSNFNSDCNICIELINQQRSLSSPWASIKMQQLPKKLEILSLEHLTILLLSMMKRTNGISTKVFLFINKQENLGFLLVFLDLVGKQILNIPSLVSCPSFYEHPCLNSLFLFPTVELNIQQNENKIY